MAYAARPQYGAQPRPYHGPHTASLTVPAEHQEPTYYTQTQSSDIRPYPGSVSSRKSPQRLPDRVGFLEETSEQRKRNQLGGYSESFNRVQAERPQGGNTQGGNTQGGNTQGGNTQRPEYIGGPEHHNYSAAESDSQLGTGYQQSFSRPRKRQPQLSSEVRSPQSYNGPSRPMIPPPRSLSNESFLQMRSTSQNEGQNFTSFFGNDSNYEPGARLSTTKILGNSGNNACTSTRAVVNTKKPSESHTFLLHTS